MPHAQRETKWRGWRQSPINQYCERSFSQVKKFGPLVDLGKQGELSNQAVVPPGQNFNLEWLIVFGLCHTLLFSSRGNRWALDRCWFICLVFSWGECDKGGAHACEMVPCTCRVAFEVGFAKKDREATRFNQWSAQGVVALSVGKVNFHWIAQSKGFW